MQKSILVDSYFFDTFTYLAKSNLIFKNQYVRKLISLGYNYRNEFLCIRIILSNWQKITFSNDCNWTRTQSHLVHIRTLNHLAKLAKWLSCVLSTYLYGAFDCMFLSCHVRVFRVNPHSIVAWISRNSLLYNFLNVKKLLAWSRHKIWSLKDCNWTWTHSHLVHK